MIKLENIPLAKLCGGITVASILPFLAVGVFKSELYTVMDISSYLVFHNVAEFFSVMVSFSIFGLGWYSYDQNKDQHGLFLSVSFLAIGLMDFMHTLGYSGMPPMVTPNVTNKATLFWIVVRFFSATAFLASAFVHRDSSSCWLSKTLLMSAAVAISAGAFVGIIYFPDYLPAAFIQGIGLTPFKIVSEYVIISLMIVACFKYWRRSTGSGNTLLHYYLAAFILCIFSELVFTLYKSAFDTYNMLGHIYKVIAFYLIYKGIFIASVRKPYEDLTTSNAELCQNRNMLSNVMNNIPQAIFWKDRNSVYLGSNLVLARQAGLNNPEEIIGKSDFDLPWSREESEGYRADDHEVMEKQEEKYHIIETQRQQDGSSIWLDTTKIPLKDGSGSVYGVLGVYEDITARKQAQDALQSSEERHRTILQAAVSGFWLMDMSGRLLEVNESYCRMSGYSEQELLSMHISDLEAGETPAATEKRIQNIMTDGQDRFESRHRRKDGSIFDVEASAKYQAIEEGRIVVFLSDITLQHKLEEQFRQSQKMEAIGLLAGGVAHDFNNILSVIIGYCSLLEMKTFSAAEEKNALACISASAEKAAQLTGGLLAFSRKQVIDPKPVDLNDIVRNVQKFLVRIIGEDITLKAITNNAPLLVMADIGQLEQVLMNLATNARDAMPKGGAMTIETELQEIDGSFVANHGYGKPGQYALMSVSDTGFGMTEEVRSKIFEPFFTTKEIGKGTGLGMSIAYGIVNQHNGFIYVYSELNKGTAFKIYLPILNSDYTSDHSITVAEAPKGGAETILVAEDDASLQTFVETLLTNSGYQTITANNGEEAVELFSANSSNISLVLMDMLMPKKNGLQAYNEIKPLLGDTKVLFTSGYTADFIRSRGELDDSVELIMKPLKPAELLRKVREMLDR
jgi:PAS domain S-box-containing protein